MLACFKCGADNPEGQKYCASCGALLPQMAPTTVTGELDVDEDTEYIRPTEHFPSAEMLNLAWSLHDFLEEGAELEPFLEVYEVIKARFEHYLNNLHQDSLEYIQNDRNIDPSDPYPKQMQYLTVRAATLAQEGIEATEAFLDALDAGSLNPEQGKSGVSKIVQASDHFLLALHMSMARTQNLQDFAINNGLPIGEQAELGAEDQPEEVMVEDS